MTCLGCNEPKKVHARGLCQACYDKQRHAKRTPEEKKQPKTNKCPICGDPIHKYSVHCNSCAAENKRKPKKGQRFPIGCKVREKNGIYLGDVISGTVTASAADCKNPIFYMEAEEWVKVKMEKFGQVVPLRVSTLERVYTPVEDWTDPATDVEDDVAAIFAEVGA